jgi:hypothetical protein
LVKQLLLLERKTLLKGFLLCCVIVFPFTFFPVIFSSARSWEALYNRIPLSLLYTTVFSFVIVLAAFVQNVTNLRTKIRLFKMPALQDLGFSLQHVGAGSVLWEFAPVYVGTYEEIVFLISVEIDQDKNDRIYVILTSPGHHDASKNRLIRSGLKDLRVTESGGSLALQLEPKESDFLKNDYLAKYLSIFAAEIKKQY